MASNSPSTAQPKVADPGPLGLAAFAMTTFVLSISNAQIGTGAKGVAAAALALALVYGGIAQFAAGMWEFVRKNTFGALAFTSYGAFWISYFVFGRFIAPSIGNAGDVNAAVTVFLLSWTIFTCYMMIASFRVSTAVAVVFVLLALTFLVLTTGPCHLHQVFPHTLQKSHHSQVAHTRCSCAQSPSQCQQQSRIYHCPV